MNDKQKDQNKLRTEGGKRAVKKKNNKNNLGST